MSFYLHKLAAKHISLRNLLVGSAKYLFYHLEANVSVLLAQNNDLILSARLSAYYRQICVRINVQVLQIRKIRKWRNLSK